jgi:hypothetical protein
LGVGKLQAEECSNANYQGVYAFTLTGLARGATMPIAIVGSFTADGNGKIVGSQTNVLGLDIVRQTYTEAYTVNPDCTGSAVKHINGADITLHFDFVINQHGDKIRSIQTDSGAVVTLIAEQQ